MTRSLHVRTRTFLLAGVVSLLASFGSSYPGHADGMVDDPQSGAGIYLPDSAVPAIQPRVYSYDPYAHRPGRVLDPRCPQLARQLAYPYLMEDGDAVEARYAYYRSLHCPPELLPSEPQGFVMPQDYYYELPR